MSSPTNQEMADKAFIQGTYNQFNKEQPGSTLDKSILDMARQKIPPKKSSTPIKKKWWLNKPSLSIAASVFILSALFWQYQDMFNPTQPIAIKQPTQANMPSTEDLVFSEKAADTQMRERVVMEDITSFEVEAPDFQVVIEQLKDAPDDVDSLLTSDEVRLLHQIEGDKLKQQNLLEMEQEAKEDGGILALSNPNPELSELDLNTSVEEEVIAKANKPVDWPALDNLLARINQPTQTFQLSSKTMSSFAATEAPSKQSEDVQALYQALFDILEFDPAVEVDKKYFVPLSHVQRKTLLDMQKTQSSIK